MTSAEAAHVAMVKLLPCSVCDCPGPVEAHHIVQNQHFTVVAACMECHRGWNGWHGNKSLWRIRKMDELDALNITLARIAGCERRMVA